MLGTYLQNHEALARAGSDAFRRAADHQADTAHGPLLRQLSDDVAADHALLRGLLDRLEVGPHPALSVMARAGDRLAGHRPDGQLLSRSPLADLNELEDLLAAMRMRVAGLDALTATDGRSPVDGRIEPAVLTRLRSRAHDQLGLVESVHRHVAAAVLDA